MLSALMGRRVPCPELALIWGYKALSREKHSTFNIQHRTLNELRFGHLLKVECSKLKGECSMASGSLAPA
jgi:hypothetical protein